jgi:hypothetical protein
MIGISVMDSNRRKKINSKENATGNQNHSKEMTIRIDMRCHRIHIHKSSLEAIGSPEYIQLGYQPETKKLMILNTNTDEREAIHLHFDKKGSCYVFSKGLLEGIREISGVLKLERSYYIKGELSESADAVLFRLE